MSTPIQRCVAPSPFWLREHIRCARRCVTSPDDPRWLAELLRRSVLVPPDQQRHWRRVLPLLSTAQRYELAATLLETEDWLASAAHKQ